MATRHELIPIAIVDAGVNHDAVADTIDSAIFFSDASPYGYDDVDDFLESEQERQYEAFPDIACRLRHLSSLFCENEYEGDEPEDYKASFELGGVTAFAILDEIADTRGVNQASYRQFWTSMKHIKGDRIVSFWTDDRDVAASCHGYFGLAHKISDEISNTEQDYDAFFEGFSLLMTTGKQAITKSIMSDAALRCHKLMEGADLDQELSELTAQERIAGYEIDASVAYKWLQSSFNKYCDQYTMDVATAAKFTQYVTDQISSRKGLELLAPPDDSLVRAAGAQFLLLFSNTNVADGPHGYVAIEALEDGYIIEGTFGHVAAVSYHPPGTMSPEEWLENQSLIYGPSLCLTNATVKDTEGNIVDVYDEKAILIPLDCPNLSIHYRLESN